MVERGENSGSERGAALLTWIQQFAPYGVVTLDQALRIQEWNHWMELHSGKRREDVAGKMLFDVFPDLLERRLAAYFERALQGEPSVLSTALHGHLLPLQPSFREPGLALMLQTARISPLFSDGKVCGVVLVIEDVSQRESQARALARQHRRDELLSWALAHLLKTEQPRKAIRQLFFKIAEQLDFDTFLIYFRDLETGQIALDSVGGLPPEAEQSFLDCPFLTLLGGETQEPVILNSIPARTEPQFESFKKARISAVVAIPLAANDKNLGVICFASWSRESIEQDEVDLVRTISQFLATALDRENAQTDLRKAQRLLSEHAQLLEQRVQDRTARLKETISELESFSYTIAHDLRAPVRAVSGYCEVMLENSDNTLSPNARFMVQRIARASGRMDALTRDLLEFSRVSRQEIDLAPLELEPIIEDLAALRLPAVQQAITVRSPLHRVRAHRELLQHVFSNLVDNAVKFVQPGVAPKITIFTEVVTETSPNTRTRPLNFSSVDDQPELLQTAKPAASKHLPGYIRVWVKDEGIGIPQAAHQKIFGIFERALPVGSYEGTGMGLAIVSRAMQRMGGTCGVESEPGKGSSFWLELPAG